MRKEDYTLENGVLTIHDGVTEIGDGAFMVNNLTSVTIPNSVTEIGGWAFRGNRITSVTIPNSVTKIGAWAFMGNNLESVIIPDSVTWIDTWAFMRSPLNKIKFMTLDGCTEYDCINVDGILTFIKNKRSFNDCTVYKAQIFNGMVDKVLQLTDCYIYEKDGVFAHGRTREAAKADLLFKLAKNRGAEQYRHITPETSMPLFDAITMYRVITGACQFGVEQFIEGLGTKIKDTYTPAEIIALTDGQYGNEVFAEYFGVVRDRG